MHADLRAELFSKTYATARELHQKNQARINAAQSLDQFTVDLLQAYSRSTVIGIFLMIDVDKKEAERIVDNEIIGVGTSVH